MQGTSDNTAQQQENDDAQVQLSFDERCAQLLDPHVQPSDYDASTLYKTTVRLNNKLHSFPNDVKQALKANVQSDDQNQDTDETENESQ